VDVETNTPLGDVATLAGVNHQIIQSPNHQITVTLVWRAEAETHTSYHVFLHLIGPDPSTGSGQAPSTGSGQAPSTGSGQAPSTGSGQGGALVAQSDGIPAGWTRPTTGWLPGEYVTDVHVLTIPPETPAGDYALYAGLYVPGGERITAPDGTDAVLLTTITVEVQ